MKFSALFALVVASMAFASELLTPGENRALERKARHSEQALEKRYRVYSGGHGTWYSGNQLDAPACGGPTPSDNDHVVAVPAGSPAKCGDYIHLHYKNKMAVARVVDECGGCSNKHSVDMTKAVFQELADLDVGVLKPLRFRVLHADDV